MTGPQIIQTTLNQQESWQSPGGVTMGASATDIISFYGATPVVQRSGSSEAAVTTTAPTTTTPYGYTTSAQAAAIVTLVNEIRATLVGLGLFAGA